MKSGSELHSHVGRLYGMHISICFFTMSPIDAHLLLFCSVQGKNIILFTTHLSKSYFLPFFVVYLTTLFLI